MHIVSQGWILDVVNECSYLPNTVGFNTVVLAYFHSSTELGRIVFVLKMDAWSKKGKQTQVNWVVSSRSEKQYFHLKKKVTLWLLLPDVDQQLALNRGDKAGVSKASMDSFKGNLNWYWHCFKGSFKKTFERPVRVHMSFPEHLKLAVTACWDPVFHPLSPHHCP